MNNFFDIHSVAIVGASETEWKIGNGLIKNLSYFSGEKYWVNPKWGSYQGVDFYTSISDVPKVVDIVVFAVPAKFVVSGLQEAGEKWIKRAIVISAGFKEVGNIDEENQLIEEAKKYDIQLLGPNCLWYVDANKWLNLSFGTKTLQSCSGRDCQNIAMISQSWAMAVALTDWALTRGMWFSKMISMWNKAGINENDLLLQLEQDPETKVIALYLESIDFWYDFYEHCKRISKKMPLVLVKSGVSQRWSAAASSHTWALASNKDILYTAFEHSWIHYTQSLENFFLWSQIFSKTQLENVPDELVMITNAGWPWVMATDHSENYWVQLTSFTEEEKMILSQWLPAAASVSNPIDIIWDATSITYAQILNNLKKLKQKRAILILLTAQTVTDVENIAQVIVDFKRENPNEFIMVTFMWGDAVQKGRNILDEAGILEYDYPKKAIRAYSRLLIQKSWQEKTFWDDPLFSSPENIEDLRSKITEQTKFCSSSLTEEILVSFGINTIHDILVNDKNNIEEVYEQLGADRLVARISSPDIPHKTDVGGVVLNIESKQEAIDAFDAIMDSVSQHAPEADIHGITFSKMAVRWNASREIFVWFKRDQSFWSILIVWMWWIYVNVFEDVSRRIGIVSKQEVLEMLQELTSYPLLVWVRWEKSIDFEKLIDIIYKLQFVFKEFSDIKEIDINPIFSDEKDSIVVDAKFYL